MGETLFRLTYEIKVVIPVEIKELSRRTANPFPAEGNREDIRQEIDLL